MNEQLPQLSDDSLLWHGTYACMAWTAKASSGRIIIKIAGHDDVTLNVSSLRGMRRAKLTQAILHGVLTNGETS